MKFPRERIEYSLLASLLREYGAGLCVVDHESILTNSFTLLGLFSQLHSRGRSLLVGGRG